MPRSLLVPACLALAFFALAAPGCSSFLGDFSRGADPGDGSTTDASLSESGSSSGAEAGSSSGTDGSSSGGDGSSSGVDSGHHDSGPTDSGLAGDGNDGGCPSTEQACNGVCVPKDDPAHCGSCTHDCNALPNVTGSTTCSAGVCDVPATSCAPGYLHCSSKPDDGCEVTIGPANCGTCGTVCPAADPVCTGGAGSYGCGTSCSGATPDYCPSSMTCTNFQTDPQNCNGCANACPTVPNGSATCSMGACGFTCSVGFHVCGNSCANSTSPGSCGTSCTPCVVPNASAGCNTSGQCTVGTCTPGYADCNMNPADGCEVNTNTDPNNCSGCGLKCVLPNAAPACVGGACAIGSCNPGYADCNMVPTDGCEVNTSTDPNNCGTCGFQCTGGETCVSGKCVCGGGTTFCGTSCVNLQTDSNNCGACGQVCAGTSCNAGYCVPVVLASGAQVSAPYDIATDGGYVFWTNYANPGTVGSVSGSGGGYLAIATNVSFPQDIAAHAGMVYFTLENAGAQPKLMSVTNLGAALAVLAVGPMGPGQFPNGIAFDQVGGNTLYWEAYGGGSYTIYQYTVSTANNVSVRGPISNTNIAGLAAENGDFFFTEPLFFRAVQYPQNFAFDTSMTRPGRMFATGGYVYYLDRGTGGNGSVRRAKDDVSAMNTIASSLSSPAYVTSDGVNVYWTDTTDGAIYRAPVTGGTPFALVKQAGLQALTVDASYVYFVNSTNSQIARIPK